MKKTDFIVFIFFFFLACNKVEDYNELDGPRFLSNDYSSSYDLNIDAATLQPKVKVISYNIKYGEELAEAIKEISTAASLKGANIVLLQEMDEISIEKMASALNMNYLYYPSAYNKKNKKNFGTGILTTGLITGSKKLFLPHEKWTNGRKRHVSIAFIEFKSIKVAAYSVHTETLEMSKTKRMEQVDSLIADAKILAASYNQIIIGGDFNTLSAFDVRDVITKFKDAGFTWASKNAGYTAHSLIYRTFLDYIFTMGFIVEENGKLTSAQASDHKPIYTNLILK